MKFSKLLLLGLFAGLAACADDKKDHPICPQVAILRELQQVQDYGTEASDPNNLVAEAAMRRLDGDCGYTDKGIDIAFTVDMAARRGPRVGDRVSFPFFVAVADPDRTILQKELMTEDFIFDDDKVVERQESLHIFIPLPKDQQAKGPDYQVLTGFQLTEEQLKAVRGAADKQN